MAVIALKLAIVDPIYIWLERCELQYSAFSRVYCVFKWVVYIVHLCKVVDLCVILLFKYLLMCRSVPVVYNYSELCT